MQQPAFTGHIVQGSLGPICTHKDQDQACGCVRCLFCEITMIPCENRAQGSPCVAREDVRTLDDRLTMLSHFEAMGPTLRENRAQWAYRLACELDELVQHEERLLAGEDVVMIVYGRRTRYVL